MYSWGNRGSAYAYLMPLCCGFLGCLGKLLLDEPSLGLAPLLVHTIFMAIDEINKEGVTILLVEQNANAALKHSHRGYVLETGCIVMQGPSQQLASDPRVKEAYLGEK